MENFLRVDIFMVVVVILVLWSVAVAWIFKLGLYRDYERKIKNLTARTDSQNSETERVLSLLARVSKAFESMLDRLEENDKQIRASHKQLKNLSDLVKSFEHRMSEIEQVMNLPTEPGRIESQSKRKPVIDDVEEFSDDEEVQMGRGVAMEPEGLPDHAIPQSRPQRRGNPTGRVQL